jgi:hypothetical protein
VLFLPLALFQGHLPVIDFHGDLFCRKVFNCLWNKREHQTCIRKSDGFKYLDLRELELEFDQRTQLLIRQEYSRLANKLEEVYQVYLTHKEPGGVAVTGQAGIGKLAPCFQRKTFNIFNRENTLPSMAPARSPLGW